MLRSSKIPEQTLFEDLARVATHQKYISRDLYRTYGQYSATTIAHRFEGWWRAIYLAGRATGNSVLKHTATGSHKELRESKRLTAIANQYDEVSIKRWTPAEIEAKWPHGYDTTKVRELMTRNFRGPTMPLRQL